MSRNNILIVISLLLISSVGFGQSKTELIAKVAQQEKTIDSLKKVVANFDNIVENRDRSIKILEEDRATLSKEKFAAEKITREKEIVIRDLKSQSATGEAKIITLSNARSTIKVKEGKFWIINQLMTDYSASISTDSSGNKIIEEVHVFIQAINDDILTDPSKKMYGPQLYSSLHPEQTMRFPIIITENVKFSIAVYKGKLGALTPYEANVYLSLTEKDN